MWLIIEIDRHLFLKISCIRFDQNVGNCLWDTWKVQMALCRSEFSYGPLAVKIKIRRKLLVQTSYIEFE
jgi:hypothetical protein